MLEVRYDQTGTKEKPSYDVVLFQQSDKIKSEEKPDPITIPLGRIEKTEVQTEMGPILGWVADVTHNPTIADTTLKARSLREIKSELELALIQRIAGTPDVTVPGEHARPASFNDE